MRFPPGSIARKASALYDAALAVVYPQPCMVCGIASVEHRGDGMACAGCWRSTTVFDGAEPLCSKCGKLLPVERPSRTSFNGGWNCRACGHEPFSAARAVGGYDSALRASILFLKHEPFVPQRIIDLLGIAHLREPLCRATRIIPVPLHSARLRERGFNQAAVLARALARACRLPCDEHSLARSRNTERHRAGMDARARRESVHDAFRATRPRLISGERVLLVDDVFTTGATVAAGASALMAAGAAEVMVLTVARPL